MYHPFTAIGASRINALTIVAIATLIFGCQPTGEKEESSLEDSGDAVSELYETPGEFEGGVIQAVGVTVEGTPYVDLEAEAKRLMMTQ